MRKIFEKVITILLLIFCSLALLITALVIFDNARLNKNNDGVVPVESITGINTSATLKSGCYVKEGVSFIDGQGFAHGMVMAMNGEPGLKVSSIRIIDVYGSECTIVFQCSDSSDGGLWIETDYPLSNLNYNEAKVRRADDGIKSDYYSQRFTVRGTGIGSINPVFWIIDLFSVFTIVFIIVRKVRAKRNS